MATHLKMTNTKGKEEMTISKKTVPEHICRSKGFKCELNAKEEQIMKLQYTFFFFD